MNCDRSFLVKKINSIGKDLIEMFQLEGYTLINNKLTSDSPVQFTCTSSLEKGITDFLLGKCRMHLVEDFNITDVVNISYRLPGILSIQPDDNIGNHISSNNSLRTAAIKRTYITWNENCEKNVQRKHNRRNNVWGRRETYEEFFSKILHAAERTGILKIRNICNTNNSNWNNKEWWDRESRAKKRVVRNSYNRNS